MSQNRLTSEYVTIRSSAEWSGVRAQRGLSKSGGYRSIERQRHINNEYQESFNVKN